MQKDINSMFRVYNLRISTTVLMLIMLFINDSVQGQIGGQVKNTPNDQPIPRAHINLTNKILGTSTNNKGENIINWDSFPIKINVSAIGFETKTILLNQPDSSITVYLKEKIMGLDEIMVVSDRTINPITKTSSIATSTISAEQLSAKSVTTAVELLRAETGVYVQQTSVGQGSLYIRGRAGRDVLYLFNGFRMNPSFVRSGQNQYFGAIDPLLLSKLDVYRGPVSVYYGSDALSGGVNISPLLKNFSNERIITGEVSSFLNFSGNGEKSIHGKIGYQSPKFTVFAGGSYRDYEFYNMSKKTDKALWFPFDETLSNADYQFKSFQLSSKIKTSNSSNISLVSYVGQIPDAPRIDRQTLGFRIENEKEGITPRYAYYSNTSPLIFWGNTAEYRSNNDNQAFENIGIKLGYFRLNDYRKQNDFDLNNLPSYSLDPNNIDYSFSVSDTTDYDRSSSNQLLGSIDIQSKINNNLYMKWGGDISIDYVNSQRFSNAGETRLPRYPNGSTYILSGFFAQIDIAPIKKITIEYGARYSHIYANIPFEGVNSDRKYDPYSDTFGHLTHALGLSYQISKKLSLLSNVSTGFRAPNISDLSEIGERRDSQFKTPNAELRPETTRNLDLGVIYNSKNYDVQLYAFWLHYSNKITSIETGNIVNDLGEIVLVDSLSSNAKTFIEVQNVNANSMDLLGIEFSGEYMNDENLKTGITFTYAFGNLLKLDGSSEPVDRIPPANGLFYIDYSPSPTITIRPQARYAFTHRRISPLEVLDNRISKNGTDGFVNLQLLVNIHPEDNIAIKFIADNLIDEAYREHASSLDGMGRNFTISLTYTF